MQGSCKPSSVSKVVTKGECAGSCKCRLPKLVELSPLRLLKRISHKVMRYMSGRRCLLKVSSGEKPKTLVPPNDSHRSEAVEDCIKFINSSSSVPGSNPVKAKSC